MSAEKQKRSVQPELIVLTVIILVQCITMFLLFTFQKNIYFTDEYYSYGISNSFRRPYLTGYSPTQNTDSYTVPDWLGFTGDDFKYYLRTNPETAFRYDSVWYNAELDTMPPLYYALLHTICSVNPGHFSWYDAFIINLVCLVITQIFVYLLATEITHNKWVALLTVAFWGFSLGGISCFTYLRMYAMMAMFCMIFAWQSARVHSKDKLRWSEAVWYCAITFLGAMTHHIYLVFAFFCTVFSCIFLLFSKSFRKFFLYGFSVLGGVVLSVVVFPDTIAQMTSGANIWSVDPYLPGNAIHFQFLIKHSLTGITNLNHYFVYPHYRSDDCCGSSVNTGSLFVP